MLQGGFCEGDFGGSRFAKGSAVFFFFFFNHTKGEIPGPSAELTLWKSTRTSPPREEASRGAGDGWHSGQEPPETPFWPETFPARLSLASAASQNRRPHRRRRPPFWSPKFGASAASAAPAARLRGRGDPVRAPPTRKHRAPPLAASPPPRKRKRARGGPRRARCRPADSVPHPADPPLRGRGAPETPALGPARPRPVPRVARGRRAKRRAPLLQEGRGDAGVAPHARGGSAVGSREAAA